jgi:hypothetical protein
MAVPIRIPDHVVQALGHLTETYAAGPITTGLLAALVGPMQAIEDALNGVMYSGLLGSSQVLIPLTPPNPETGAVDLTNATLATVILDGNGKALDQVGSLLAQPRGGLSDADYLTVLKATILVLRSRGKTKDITNILVACTPVGSTWDYSPSYPCGFIASVYGNQGPAPLAAFLRKAAPSGVKVLFQSNVTSLATTEFWGSTYGTVTTLGLTKWGSTYGTATGAGTWANVVAL